MAVENTKMSVAGRSNKIVPPVFPSCPTCGKEMRFTGHAPACESVIYDFLCSDDGDRLSWQRAFARPNRSF